MKFNEEAIEELKKNFEADELETIDILISGKIKFNSIKKVHLETFKKVIHYLSKKLSWNEDEEHLEDQNDEFKDASETTNDNEENDKTDTNVQDVKKSSEKIVSDRTCKFFKRGKCKFGKSGKSCEFKHPQTCKKFTLFGYKQGGCKDKNCPKLHLSVCKIFMRHQSCKYGDDCKFFHPRRLNVHNQANKSTFYQTHIKDGPTYAQILKKPVQPLIQSIDQNDFLGQNQLHQPVLRPESQLNQPSISQRNQTQVFLDLQNGQKQIMEMFTHLNQKMMNLQEKYKFQV